MFFAVMNLRLVAEIDFGIFMLDVLPWQFLMFLLVHELLFASNPMPDASVT